MLNILLYGVLVHLLFLASIFVVYFQSPVIQGLRPQPDLSEPPARRLVLMVADGLRAESFYRDGCARTPFLRDLMLSKGVQGISNTRIPTESRPGHVALIAGLYEDPSAVLRGWQKNPVDFDSLFNRSRLTYAWGSPDILSVFQMDGGGGTDHIHTHSYDPSAEDFSGASATTLLDQWVFDRAAEHVRRHREAGTLHSDHPERTVLFLHLLGLDTAGHVHKPNSALFDDNLRAVDRGVEQTVRLVEEAFGDGRTAFVFTADHGMTDAGAHGAGAAHETQTPFVAWGAGVADWREIAEPAAEQRRRRQAVGPRELPCFDIEQADAAPLMAALIGCAVPVNNFGRLPHVLLNASERYVAQAMQANALQMAGQFGHLRRKQASGWLAGWLGDYGRLNGEMQAASERQIEQALANGQFEAATQLSADYLQNALLGIEYYQQYYQYALLFAVCVSMGGWLVYLLQSTRSVSSINCRAVLSGGWHKGLVGAGALAVATFVFAQGIPLHVGAFFMLPILCWLPCSLTFTYHLLIDYHTWLFALAADALVWTFFYRSVLGLLFTVLPVFYVLSFEGSRISLLRRNFPWIYTCFLLGVFTILPAVGRSSPQRQQTLLLYGLFAWLVRLVYRTFFGRDTASRVRPMRIANLVLATVAATVVVHVTRGFDRQHGLSVWAQAAAWLLSAAAMVVPLLQTRVDRVQLIADSLCQPYMLLSLSYEPLFLLVLTVNLTAWQRMEARERYQPAMDACRRVRTAGLDSRTVRRSYVMLAYVLVSFFGTGNLASISSFDPSSVRCFVGTFSPFVMAGLIVWKLFVPVLLVVCASTAIGASGRRRSSADSMIVCVLLICDIMCVHFLFLVRNKGSWLDIGVSISHFVIMESTVLVLLVLERIARKLLHVKLLDGGDDEETSANSYMDVKLK